MFDDIHKHGYSKYETLLFNITYNAFEKLVASIELYVAKCSYTSSFYLAVIAEEELAKLIILPIAKELDEVEDLLEIKKRRNSEYYNHIVKQRVFASHGLRNRDHKDLEKLKQKCLYAGVDSKLDPVPTYITPEANYDELKHALILFADLVNKTILMGEFKDKYKKMMLMLLGLLKGCVNDKIPEIKDEILKTIDEEEKSIADDLKKDPERFHEHFFKKRVLTNPYEFIKFVKALYGSEYKQHLSEVKFKSYDEVVKYFGESLDLENST